MKPGWVYIVTGSYNFTQLIWCEDDDAIAREKQAKHWKCERHL